MPALALPAPRVKAAAETPAVISLPDQTPRQVRRHQEYGEAQTEYRLRGTILEQLDYYMHYIRRMKAKDRNAYSLYARIGARIVPHSVHFDSGQELSPWFRDTLPTFGCIAVPAGDTKRMQEWEKKNKKTFPRFAYFTKYQRPPSIVQTINEGAIYVMATYWDESKVLGCADFAVQVLPDGTVRPLRVMTSEAQIIRHRRGHEASVIRHQKWGLPPFVHGWAEENNEPPHEFIRRFFIKMANEWAQAANSMITVTAKKNAVAAAFSVDFRSVPMFFRDREDVVTPQGKKARIFHIVRPHLRTLKDGRKIAVRTHFAGVRRFMWNGYDIHINVAGWHHNDFNDLDLGVLDEEWMENGVEYGDNRRIGQVLANVVSQGLGRRLQRSGPVTLH